VSTDSAKDEGYKPAHRNHLPENYDPVAEKSPYRPNRISLRERLCYAALSVAFLGYAAVALLTDDFYIPGRRNYPGMHLHGYPVVLMAIAIFSACVALIAVIVDHYDKRDNELIYKKVIRISALSGAALFCAALLLRVLEISR
jgi:hypothetical protein